MFIKLLKNIAALTFGTLVAILLLEGFLHIYNPFHFRVKGGKISLPVNRVYRYDNIQTPKLDKELTHTKNSLGFRGEEPPENLQDYLSIVAVGGSTTEDFYLSDGKDWPAKLAQKLKGRFDKLWLNNAGLDGQSTFGHAILLEDYVAKIKPKIVLFYVGANDVGRNDLRELDKRYLVGYSANWINFLSKNSEIVNIVYNLKRYWGAKEEGLGHAGLDLLKTEVLEIPDAEITKEEENNRQNYAGAYKERLQKLIDVSRKNGIEPVIMTQATLVGSGIDPATNVNLATIKLGEKQNGLMYSRILEVYNDTARQVAADNNVLLIDAAKKMPKNSEYYYDDLHNTAEGAQKLAEIISEDMIQYLSAKYPGYLKSN